MSETATTLPAEEPKHESATVNLEDGSQAPRYGVTPYGGLPAAGDTQQDSQEL